MRNDMNLKDYQAYRSLTIEERRARDQLENKKVITLLERLDGTDLSTMNENMINQLLEADSRFVWALGGELPWGQATILQENARKKTSSQFLPPGKIWKWEHGSEQKE